MVEREKIQAVGLMFSYQYIFLSETQRIRHKEVPPANTYTGSLLLSLAKKPALAAAKVIIFRNIGFCL